MSDDYEGRESGSPEFNAPDLPAFDPSSFPGAQVIAEDGDFKAVAVPVSALTDLGPAGLASLAGSLPPEVAGLLGIAVPAGEDLRLTMRQFQWATDELEKAKERHPEKDPAVFDDAFVVVKPDKATEELLAPEDIYRAHARELFDRLAAGEDTSRATDGEVLGLLVNAFGYQPFCGGLMSLYISLSEKIVPEVYNKFLAEDEETPETIADFHRENKVDADHHREEIEGLLKRDRTATPRTALPVDDGDDMLDALASLADLLGLPGLDEG